MATMISGVEASIAEWFDYVAISPVQYGLCALAIMLATAVHRMTGQVFGIISAPLVALVAPDHIPALILLSGLPVMLYSLNVDWREVRWREISFLLSGRAVGAVAAGGLTMALSNPRLIGLSVGVCVLAGVGLSFTRLRLPVSPLPLTIAGALSGFMATLTSVGAPPIALLYQHEAFTHTRATLNAYFLFGATISLLVLFGYGLIRLPSVALFGTLLPAMALGVLVGDVLLRRSVITSLRPISLGVAVLAASALIGRSVL
jgi:uncharacterized protein